MAPRRPASPPCRRTRRCSSQRLRLRRSPASGHAHALCPAIAGASSSPHLLRLTSGRCCFVAGELASASTPAAASLAPTPCLASCLQHAPLEVCVPAPSAKTSPASTCLGRGGRTASPPARVSPSVRCPAAFFLSLPRSQNPGTQGRLRRSFSPSTTPGEDQDRDLLEQERFWDRQGHLKYDYVLPPQPRPTSTTTTRHVHLPPSSEPLRTASTSASTVMPDA